MFRRHRDSDDKEDDVVFYMKSRANDLSVRKQVIDRPVESNDLFSIGEAEVSLQGSIVECHTSTGQDQLDGIGTSNIVSPSSPLRATGPMIAPSESVVSIGASVDKSLDPSVLDVCDLDVNT